MILLQHHFAATAIRSRLPKGAVLVVRLPLAFAYGSFKGLHSAKTVCRIDDRRQLKGCPLDLNASHRTLIRSSSPRDRPQEETSARAPSEPAGQVELARMVTARGHEARAGPEARDRQMVPRDLLSRDGSARPAAPLSARLDQRPTMWTAGFAQEPGPSVGGSRRLQPRMIGVIPPRAMPVTIVEVGSLAVRAVRSPHPLAVGAFIFRSLMPALIDVDRRG